MNDLNICKRFDHSTVNCKATAICFLCKSTKHKDGECKTPINKQCCINCDQNHHSYAKRCQVYKEIKANQIDEFIQKLDKTKQVKIRSKNKVTHFTNTVKSLNIKNSSKDFAQTVNMKEDILNIRESNNILQNNFCLLMKNIEESNLKQDKFLSQFNIEELALKIEKPIISKLEIITKKSEERLTKIENNFTSLKNSLIKKGLITEND